VAELGGEEDEGVIGGCGRGGGRGGREFGGETTEELEVGDVEELVTESTEKVGHCLCTPFIVSLSLREERERKGKEKITREKKDEPNNPNTFSTSSNLTSPFSPFFTGVFGASSCSFSPFTSLSAGSSTSASFTVPRFGLGGVTCSTATAGAFVRLVEARAGVAAALVVGRRARAGAAAAAGGGARLRGGLSAGEGLAGDWKATVRDTTGEDFFPPALALEWDGPEGEEGRSSSIAPRRMRSA
jgi:hypothetical protein